MLECRNIRRILSHQIPRHHFGSTEMADEEQPKSSGDIASKIKDGVTNLRPKALSIIKFWQGVVDICIRASVAVSAFYQSVSAHPFPFSCHHQPCTVLN